MAIVAEEAPPTTADPLPPGGLVIVLGDVCEVGDQDALGDPLSDLEPPVGHDLRVVSRLGVGDRLVRSGLLVTVVFLPPS